MNQEEVTSNRLQSSTQPIAEMKHCFKGKVMTVATNSVSDSCSSNLFLRRAGKALCPRAEGSRTRLHQTFDELAAPHAKRIFHAAYRITRNRQDAEDAVQDALLQAFVHLEHFDGRSTFATWLTRIAINSSLMILRKRRHARAVSLEEAADFEQSKILQGIRDEGPDAEQQYLKKELKTSLQDAVRTLRPSLRKVVEFGQLEDRSWKETADLLGVTLSAAKARLFHARQLLRRSQKLRGLYGYEPSGNQLSTRAAGLGRPQTGCR